MIRFLYILIVFPHLGLVCLAQDDSIGDVLNSAAKEAENTEPSPDKASNSSDNQGNDEEAEQDQGQQNVQNPDAATDESESGRGQPSAKQNASQDPAKSRAEKNEVLNEPSQGGGNKQAGKDRNMPELLRHSQNNFSAYQGDQISLSVEAVGAGLRYRWVRNYKTICRDAACTFASSNWGVGKQNIVLVVYNRFGSRSVDFNIRLMSRALGQEAQQLVPDMMQAEQVESLKRDDLYVKSVGGIGYTYVNRQVKVIGRLPRLLRWNEQVRTHVKGRIMFGKQGEEEYFLFPGSSAQLNQTAEGRRTIKLDEGSIRIRQLNEKEPRWSALVADWVQIDGDKDADIFIERTGKGGSAVAVTVARGTARVAFLEKVGGQESELKKVFVRPGFRLVVDPDKGALPIELTNRAWQRWFRLSSPQYYLKTSFPYKGAFISPDIDNKNRQSLAEAFQKANEAFSRGDFILVLENLLPVFEKNNQDFDLTMLVARSYRALGLYKPALNFYKTSMAIDPKNPVPFFEAGEIHLSLGRWQQALGFLEQADDFGYLKTQNLHYSLGVALYNLGKKKEARLHFENSLHEMENEDLAGSAREFIWKIKDSKPFGAIGRIGVGKDSNIFRWGDAERTSDYEPDASMYYLAYGELYYRAFASESGELKFAYDINNRGYLSKSESDINYLMQNLYLDWLLLLGGDVNAAAFELRLKPRLSTMSIGEERSADIIAMGVGVKLPATLLRPSLTATYETYSDPLPARDDKLDVLTFEPVLPSDRSAVVMSYGLGLDFIATSYHLLDLNVNYQTATHKESAISVDDFTYLTADLSSHYKIMFDFEAKGGLGYGARNFSKSTDSRKDTQTKVKLGCGYLFNAAIRTDLNIDYLTQKSNRDIASYNRYNAELVFQLEL